MHNLLITQLPEVFQHGPKYEAIKDLARVGVIASHLGMDRPWIGDEKNVWEWYLLENGIAVGVQTTGKAGDFHLVQKPLIEGDRFCLRFDTSLPPAHQTVQLLYGPVNDVSPLVAEESDYLVVGKAKFGFPGSKHPGVWTVTIRYEDGVDNIVRFPRTQEDAIAYLWFYRNLANPLFAQEGAGDEHRV